MSNSYYEKVSGETKKIDVPFAIPESWSWARLSSLCNIKGGKRIPKGFSFSTTPTKHIYIRVTDMKCQSIDISDLKYISDEVFEQIKQYTINDSDVYVSIAGTIGKVGTIPHMLDGMSLTENAVKLCNIQIDKDWLVTVLSSDFGQMKMVDRIHQVAQPKLSIISLSNTLIPIPPIEEQRRIHQQIKKTVSKLSLIASALSDIKELGTKLKYEILNYFFGDNSRYKSYYENDLKLGDILEYEQPAKYIVNSMDYSDDFATPVLTPGKTFILGYTDEKDGIYKVNGGKVIIFDDFTTASRLVDFDFKVKSSAMKILTVSNQELFDVEYMYLLLQTIHVNNNTHKRYWISDFATRSVRIHTIQEQTLIVKEIISLYSIIEEVVG